MANKKKKMNDQKDLKENTFSKEGLEKNSQKIRFKIYFYGLTIVFVVVVVTFLFNRVSFVTG